MFLLCLALRRAVIVISQVPDLVPIVLVEFDYLVTKDKIEEDENFKDFLNLVVSKDLNSQTAVVKALVRGELQSNAYGSSFVVCLRGYRYLSFIYVRIFATLDSSMRYNEREESACLGGNPHDNTRALSPPHALCVPTTALYPC